MFKSVLVIMTLLLAISGEGTQYEVSFFGEGLGPVEEISLCADEYSLYLAYIPPDSSDTVVVKLSPELQELGSVRIENFASPCIKVYNKKIYLAGIRNEQIIVHVLSDELEFLDDFTMEVEEPVDVYILPGKEGILLSYAHRFLEDNLLRQDVFLKKVDFSFREKAATRLTSWEYWEDPSIAVYGDTILLCYANAPLVSFLDRHVVITTLNWDLETLGEVRYPAAVSEDVPKRNVVQPEITALDDGVLLLFRVTDRDFSFTQLTWEGVATVIPGNIGGLPVSDELAMGDEIAITSDSQEQYQPAAVSAFGKVYFAYAVSEKEVKNLHIICADTVDELKVEPPPWWQNQVYQIAGIALVIGIGVILLGIMKRSKFKKKKKEKKEKGKKKSRK